MVCVFFQFCIVFSTFSDLCFCFDAFCLLCFSFSTVFLRNKQKEKKRKITHKPIAQTYIEYIYYDLESMRASQINIDFCVCSLLLLFIYLFIFCFLLLVAVNVIFFILCLFCLSCATLANRGTHIWFCLNDCFPFHYAIPFYGVTCFNRYIIVKTFVCACVLLFRHWNIKRQEKRVKVILCCVYDES